MTARITRRQAIFALAMVSGGLALGSGCRGKSSSAPAPIATTTPKPDEIIRAYLEIDRSGTVTITVPASEMGQGATTALPMILAEELDASWDRVRFEQALPAPVFGEDMSTEGSATTNDHFAVLRQVGATARAMLVAAAARKWQVSATECTTSQGVVLHAKSGRRTDYGSLASDAAALPVPSNVVLKPVSEFRTIGKSTTFIDLVKKTNGSAVYGIDVKVPGMLIGAIKHCPRFGSKLGTVDKKTAEAMPSVHSVVELDDAIVVVADTFWQASTALQKLDVQGSGGADVDDAAIDRAIADALSRPGSVAETPTPPAPSPASADDLDRLLNTSTAVVDATYRFPFLAHATMEPMNCTAVVSADRCEVWAPTQAQTRAQAAAMRVTGLLASRVILHTTYLGGGFGRRSNNDFVEKAVRVAKEVGRPVKVIWSREEDMRNDHYRPVVGVRVQAGFHRIGKRIAIKAHVVGPSISAAWQPETYGASQYDEFSMGGIARLPYSLLALRAEYTRYEPGMPVWFWRSVSNSHNTYAVECTLDELAQAVHLDPVELRLRMLKYSPRGHAVVERVASVAGWDFRMNSPTHFGIAYVAMRGSHMAVVVEITMPSANTVHLEKITCAVDCGMAVNPQAIEEQAQGGIVYGLSGAVWGEISIDDGKPVQRNFDQYKVARIRHVPPIEVSIIKTDAPPQGIGEVGAGVIAPALANAVAAATGRRIRRLPFTRNGLDLA